MPAIVKILIVFAAMLFLARLRIPLGLALVVGGVGLNVWAGQTFPAALGNLGRSLAGSDLWLLLVITVLIEMSRFMTEGRNAEALTAAARRWGGRHGRAATFMALPAVIGLIPMAAGALVSAPFVQQAGAGTDRSADWKSAVNYWFRHIWEFWWPLYPGVIVGMSIFGMDAWQFITALIGYTPVAAAGYCFLIRPHAAGLAQPAVPPDGSNRRAFLVLSPLLVVVTAMFLLPYPLRLLLPGVPPPTRKMLAMLIGLAAGLGVILVVERRSRLSAPAGADPAALHRRMFSTLFEPGSVNIMITLAGGLLFKSLLDRSGLLPEASRELVASGIPVVAAVASLPLLAGLITGMSVGYAGTAFPLVVGLMNVPGSALTPWATVVLACGFGYVGMMLSPVHLCLLASRDYFKSDLWSVYRHLWPCALTVTVFGLAAHALLRLAGW
jgi:hypothetical protein